MTYGDFIKQVSTKTEHSQLSVKTITAEVFSQISSLLEENGEITIPGFGKFSVKEVRERKGVNPSTGEKIVISAHKKPHFRPSEQLREKVR